MEKSASQIATEVLHNVESLNMSLYCGMSRLKLAAKKKKPPFSLPSMLGLGAAGGTAAGVSSGLLSNVKNLKTIRQLKERLPGLEAQREMLKGQGFTNRKDLRKILTQFPLPNENYYALRRGYEQAFPERSRVAKTLNALKKITRKKMLRNTLLGTGAGLGVGLLGATAFGQFD